MESDKKKLLGMVDHTLLLQTATWEEIKALCDDAMEYGTASVCIPPCYVKPAKEYVGEKMKICTVIVFPNLGVVKYIALVMHLLNCIVVLIILVVVTTDNCTVILTFIGLKRINMFSVAVCINLIQV